MDKIIFRVRLVDQRLLEARADHPSLCVAAPTWAELRSLVRATLLSRFGELRPVVLLVG